VLRRGCGAVISRREVIALSLSGAWSAAGLASALPDSSPLFAEIHTRHLRARFDPQSGLFHAWLADGTALLLNAAVRAVGPTWSCSSSDPMLVRTATVARIQDALGSGSKIAAVCRDKKSGIALSVEISLYADRNALLVEARCHNDSGVELSLRTLEPLRAVADAAGLCAWPYLSKSLTNGFLYADPGNLNDFSQTRNRPQHSVWNMGFAGAGADPGLAIGFVENDFAIGRITAAAASVGQRDGMSLVAEAYFNQEFVLQPGASAQSGRFALQIGPDPFSALEYYAQMIGDAHEVRIGSVINGWCNWFYDHANTSEAEILGNAEFAALHLKPYGLEWIQIDDGYQRSFSDWEGNERFPHGMKWLAQRIRELGLRPGIWIAPYVVSEGTDVHRHHPDWLIRDLDGSLRHCGNRGTTKLYGLDISVPAAADWLRGLLHRVANEWGYDFIKIDFVEWTVLAAERYSDPGWSRASAYRRGAEIIREAIGPARHLLDCGPAQVTVGLLDSTRIELDQPFLTWEQYTGNFNSSAPAMAKRYYFHRRTWINDADHLGTALLTPSAAAAAASIVALSGGTMISGDRLTELDDTRLDIVRKVFPSFGEAARPIDLFEREKPEIFLLPVKMPFEQWAVVGLFNYESGGAVEKSVTLAELGLDTGQRWLAFDFWQQRLLGSVEGRLHTLVPAAAVALVALRRDRGVPQVISTDRHFTQGGVELRAVDWNADSHSLSGTSLGGSATAHNVFIYMPPGFALAHDSPELPHDSGSYSVTLRPDGLVRVHVMFATGADQVTWRLQCRRIAS
jgi:alpha-galactosidase